MSGHTPPAGWSISADYIGYTASHDNFDASYEGPEDGWVGNGLCCWGHTVEECLEQIAEIEAEHPHFDEQRRENSQFGVGA